MRNIDVKKIEDIICDKCKDLAYFYSDDIRQSLKDAYDKAEGKEKVALDILNKNADIAKNEEMPICQDTGMIIAFVKVGQDIHFENGDIKEAINNGIAKGYQKYFLRNSVVNDPLFDRTNTKNNTPSIIYFDIVKGDSLTIEMSAKGFGSENMSRIKMLKPAQGVDGVKEFVLESVKLAGPNACPPMIIGVGIGGDFEYSALLSKKALLRPLDKYNEDPRYQDLEKELLEEINKLNIGALGLHGKTTALRVMIEHYPTHIAGMPCAVNICCHVSRHIKVEL